MQGKKTSRNWPSNGGRVARKIEGKDGVGIKREANSWAKRGEEKLKCLDSERAIEIARRK